MDYIILDDVELLKLGLKRGPVEYDNLIDSLPPRTRQLFRKLEKLPPVKQYLTERTYKEIATRLRYRS